MANDLQQLLARSGSTMRWVAVDSMSVARQREMITRDIASNYPAFEGLRDTLLQRRAVNLTAVHLQLLKSIGELGLAQCSGEKWYVGDSASRRYLTGGWLEEYVALAIEEIGADEVLIGQKISWQVGEFVGENEIDVLARFGDRLFMCSCKALKSVLLPDDARTRERLMDALHEADNLADHFSPSGGVVALAVTTDLVDERLCSARYQQLHGKAAVLGVGLITLEHMPWAALTRRLNAIVVGGL